MRLFDMIRHVYGNKPMSRARYFEWQSRFESGKMSKWPSTRSNPETILHEDRRRSINDMAAIVDVSYGTLQAIVTSDLNIHRIAATFVPRLQIPWLEGSPCWNMSRSPGACPWWPYLHVEGREIAQWVHSMKDRSDDPSHHERTLYLWATSRTPTQRESDDDDMPACGSRVQILCWDVELFLVPASAPRLV